MKLMAAKIGWFEVSDSEQLGGTMQYLLDNAGVGGERRNFIPYNGAFYGYIKGKQGKVREDGSVLDQPPAREPEDEAGWTIAFISRDEAKGGQRLIGWYENATLVHDMDVGYRVHRPRPGGDGIYCAMASRAFFVPEHERTLDLTQGSPLLNSTSYSWLISDDGKFDAIRNRIATEIKRLSRTLAPIHQEAGMNTPPPERSTEDAEEDEPAPGRRGGEGKEHRALREWVLANPDKVISGRPEILWAKTEFLLPSADLVDVAVGTNPVPYVIEVKSHKSNAKDLERGIYQCVKYRAVYDALYGTKAQAILVTENVLPNELLRVCEDLLIAHVQISRNRP